MNIGVSIGRKATKVGFLKDCEIKIIDFPPIIENPNVFKEIKNAFPKIDKAVLALSLSINKEEKQNLEYTFGSVFNSVFLISEPLAGIIGSEMPGREKPIVYFDMKRENTTIVIGKIASNEDGRPYLNILNNLALHNIGEIDIDYAILEYIMDGNRAMRDIFPGSSKKERSILISEITKARESLLTNEQARIEWKAKDFFLQIILTKAEFEKIIAPIIEGIRDIVISQIKECNLSDVFFVIPNGIAEVKNMLFGLCKEYIEGEWLITKGATLYLGIDYKKVSIQKGKKASVVDCSYGFFYDRFVPSIHKGDLFTENGIIKREVSLGFNRPDGQLPLIKKTDNYYQLLGLFSFFLPVKEPYSLFISLELSDKIILVGKHPDIGEVIYSNIPLTGEKGGTEGALIEKIQSQIFKPQELYGKVNFLDAIKEGEWMLKKIEEFKRIPIIKEQGFRLAYFLDILKEVCYSRTFLENKVENSAISVLNKISESLFLLLRYSLIPSEEYRNRLASLHRMYTLK